MWFLATRGRPDQCRDLIAAFKATGDIPEVAVMIDDDRAAYADIEWPVEWHIHHSPEHWEMTRCINELYSLYPDRPCYGFFADHFRPLTPMWEKLREAAGDWFIAWPSDGGFMSHHEFAGAPTFGTKLLREVGWICLPSTIHVATEGPWQYLWYQLGIVRHVTDTLFTRTWPNIYQGIVPRNYKGLDYNMSDCESFLKWRDEAMPLVNRIREKMKEDGFEFGPDGLIDPKYDCLPYGKIIKITTPLSLW